MVPEGALLPVETADGSWTLRVGAVGEACHSLDGAWTEARERYAQGVLLRERARGGELAPARLLDVGTGLGWNLAAALQALEGTGVALDAVGLELRPAVIEAALQLARRGRLAPPPLARLHAPVAAALERALADPPAAARVGVPLGAGRLRLLVGDGRQTLGTLGDRVRFDAVFLDPFSPRRDPALWEPGFLARIARRLAPGAVLSTYCAAFPVRLALARAGLRVGRGGRVGPKSEGTLASPDRRLPPLSPRTAARLDRALRGRSEARAEGAREEGEQGG